MAEAEAVEAWGVPAHLGEAGGLNEGLTGGVPVLREAARQGRRREGGAAPGVAAGAPRTALHPVPPPPRGAAGALGVVGRLPVRRVVAGAARAETALLAQ